MQFVGAGQEFLGPGGVDKEHRHWLLRSGELVQHDERRLRTGLVSPDTVKSLPNRRERSARRTFSAPGS